MTSILTPRPRRLPLARPLAGRLLPLAAALATLPALVALVAEAQPVEGPGAIAAAGIPLPMLRAVVNPRGVTLMGIVPDGLERDLILRRARGLYGADRVTDLMQVGPVGNPAWMSAEFLPDLRGASSATAVLADGTLRVEGEVASPEALQRIAQALADYRRLGIAVDNRLRLQAEPAR